ncbi:hypothetical protein HW555_004888 [Spodoptera exigua]|uniref:Transposase n=1 Tax=Spodoptera exigua TaxID=7107 RepID=A0A835GMC8_SPOEX|nr:hypothetical protein HW555_004888 [Spodoptera exigua]
MVLFIMPKVVKSAGREMILKVKEFCEAEQRNNGVLIPINNVRKRVAAMTGVSEKTVSRIIQEGKMAASTSKKIKSRPRRKSVNLDSFDLCAIRQKIHQFYIVKKELPTLNKLLAVLKEDINFDGSRATLHRILQSIGFRYKRCQSKRKILMERYDITAWRARYIEKMRKNRNVEKRPVVFLDETVTAEDWFKQCKHVEHLEDEYFKNDGLIDEEMDRFIISTASDSETESDHDSDINVDNSDSDCSMSGITPIDDHNYTIKI